MAKHQLHINLYVSTFAIFLKQFYRKFPFSMAGIYVHIPFCKKACHYCNFHFSTSTRLIDPFVDALIKEIDLQQQYTTEQVSSVYFGGGTPSLLAISDLNRIVQKLGITFKIAPDAEVTLEANPDDITAEKLEQWRTLGFNRLSIGVQSFFEGDLQWMNRAHNATQAVKAIHMAREHGFDNISIDLIYGTPGLTEEQWYENVQRAIDLDITHLSCYALTVEEKTPLEKMIALKKKEPVDAGKQALHFELLMKWMVEAGFEHYEISNFAKPGCRSKHNSSYWQGKPYIGLGPSAHSFNGHSRQWNVANNTLYIQSLANNTIPFEVEHLTTNQQLNEYIMTSLRTAEGIHLAKIDDDFGRTALTTLLQNAQPYLQRRTMYQSGNYLQLSPAGKLLADGIASDLFQL